MKILGIETSCDETAAAVVEDGRRVLTSVVHTQIPLHRVYGGVVPEIASRAHVEKISEVVKAALGDMRPDAVAVTYGPGLSPALLVGLNAAKGLAMSFGVPLTAVNHIEAHLHTPFLEEEGDEDVPDPVESTPALGLVISGGHTAWFDMPEYGKYVLLGQTLDDAAGEAFDKAAKLLGLGYPGGPEVDRIARAYRAENGNPGPIDFPKGRPRQQVASLCGLEADLCVSFSGLKTALLRYVQNEGGADALEARGETARVVSSYQEAIAGSVADRTYNALKRGKYRSLVVGGGVSLNSRLREVLSDVAAGAGVRLLTAKPKFCGDNAAMIAALAFYTRGIQGDEAMRIDVNPSLATGCGLGKTGHER